MQTTTPFHAQPAHKPRPMLPTSRLWQIAKEIPPAWNRLLISASILLPLLGWWLAAHIGQIDPKFLPTPEAVLAGFIRLWQTGELPINIVASLWRVGVGFLIAILVAIPIGLFMGSFASARALLEPMIGLWRYMPPPAFIPLLILYLGIGEAPKITLIVLGVIFFQTLMVMDTVKFVPKSLLETTYTLGGNRLQVLGRVILPYTLPGIIDACRINLAGAWQLVIVSELIAATEGLGRQISLAGRFLKTDEIFVGLIVIGLIGLSVDLAFKLLLKVVCPWATQNRV